MVNQLLSKIDGVDQLNNILVIGMTNRYMIIPPLPPTAVEKAAARGTAAADAVTVIFSGGCRKHFLSGSFALKSSVADPD